MARRPQPAAVREAKAPVRSARKPPEPEAVVEVVAEAPASRAPAFLKGEGLAIWNREAPRMRQARLLNPTDETAFARYCANLAKWTSLRAKLDRRGYTYESNSAHGKLRRVDPDFMVADRLERMLLASEDRFGRNPAERQRIMAARAAAGGQGKLFDTDPTPPAPRADDPASLPSAPAEAIDGPVGFLN